MLAKKLCSFGMGFALVGSICFPARADLDLFKNFKTEGSIETRSFSIDNELYRDSLRDDYRAETNVRIMLGGSFDLLDDVHSKILLDKVSRWGGAPQRGLYAGMPEGSIYGENLQTVENNVFVDNAYVKIDKVFGQVDLTIGRQFYGDPTSPVIYFGPNNDDILSVNSVDLFRADADIMGWAKFQGIAGKVVDNGNGEPPLSTVGTNSDLDLWGGELNSDKVIPKGNLAAYYYTLQWKNPGGNDTRIVYGARAAGDVAPVAGLGYKAEIIQDGGRDNMAAGTPGYGGSAYTIGLKYGRDVANKPARAKVDWSRGSDNFAAIAPSARYGIIWGEQTTQGPSTLNRGTYGTAASLSNVDIFDAGVGINPIQKLGIDFNWYRIMYDATMASVNGRSAGNELDLILSWKHSDNVYFEVNAATFQVGGALDNSGPAPNGATNPITRLGADVKIKF
jgi:hypothetical protein